MRKKTLHFTDQVEFNVITKQVQKQLKDTVETVHGTFYTDLQTGTIELTVWNDMAEDFGFQESLTIRSVDELILLTDNGDAHTVVNDIYRENHGSDIDPILLNRIYDTAIEQYHQSSGTKPVVSNDTATPEITFPFKTLREVAGVLEQMNMVYFLLARNANLI